MFPSFLPLSSQSLLCAEYPADDPYILQEFAKIQDNPVLLALHNTPFTPSNIINYISAIKHGFINPALKGFSVNDLRAAEEATNYWMFPTQWTIAIREEVAFREQDFQGRVLYPIGSSNMERMSKIFLEIQNSDDPFDLIHMFEKFKEASVTQNAAQHGDLECLKYAHENGCPWDEDTCELAAAKGDLECLKYARENGCPWDIRMCRAVAANDDVYTFLTTNQTSSEIPAYP